MSKNSRHHINPAASEAAHEYVPCIDVSRVRFMSVVATSTCATMSSSMHTLSGPSRLSWRLPRDSASRSFCTLHRLQPGTGWKYSANATRSADDASANWPMPATAAPEVETATAPSKFKLWMACIKPPMYTVAITPMVLGAVLAYYVTGVFNGAACSNLTIGGILVIAWLNLR